jgi:hypothetical protein
VGQLADVPHRQVELMVQGQIQGGAQHGLLIGIVGEIGVVHAGGVGAARLDFEILA